MREGMVGAPGIEPGIHAPKARVRTISLCPDLGLQLTAIFYQTSSRHFVPAFRNIYNSFIPGWCNGSTNGSEPFCLGSNPSPGANFLVFRTFPRQGQRLRGI